MMTPPHVIKQAFFKRKVPWFSAQIEDVPIPIHSAIGTGFNAKKRRLLRISDNFIITKVSISYGTDFQEVQNMVLYGRYHSEIMPVFQDSGYMEGLVMMVGKD